MIAVHYVLPEGATITLRLHAGESVMTGAVDNNVPGIGGQCGGAITCSTCLCSFDEYWWRRLPIQDPDEIELLSYVPEAGEHSRLGCQIRLDESLQGLVVYVPDASQ